MIVAEYLPPKHHQLWQLCLQMGVRHAIVNARPERTGLNPPWDRDSLQRLNRSFSEAGLTIHGLEGDQFNMGRIKLGQEGRDADIEHYCEMLHNMADLNIRLLCYNFMAKGGWLRSRTNVAARGGALVSGFDVKEIEESSETLLSSEELWENFNYFITRVMPVAEMVGVKMALHPDDPPLASLGGVARIFGTPEAFDRAYKMAPSPSNGVTFCRANFKLMKGVVSLGDCMRRLATEKRLFFLHLRDVRGTAESFVEVFHDQAAAEMIETLKIADEIGYAGAFRCDHVPTLAGEENDEPGYGTLGRLFADGYLIGMMDALGIRRE